MPKTLLTLLLALALTGCIIGPGGGYGDHGRDQHGWGDRDHHQSHNDQEQRGSLGR